MRITKLMHLHLFGAVALLAAAPGYAQHAPNDQLHVQVVAASVAKGATHLQRAPIEINLLNVVAAQDHAVPNGRTAIAASGRPGRN